jgi:nitrogen fixation-related uncharacterized protein
VDVVVILVFISLVLVGIAVAFFVSRLRGGDFDHGARLSLLPLQDDEGKPADEPAPTEKGPVHGNS